MSPTSIGLRVIERLHFNGNKYEFFARTKFAGCLREEGGCLHRAQGREGDGDGARREGQERRGSERGREKINGERDGKEGEEEECKEERQGGGERWEHEVHSRAHIWVLW